MTTNSPLQQILQGILHIENERKQTMRGQERSNHRRSKNKYSESSIDLAGHNQHLKQQKQLNVRNHHILININTEYQWTCLNHQKTLFGKLD
jgi:hypothetical protein